MDEMMRSADKPATAKSEVLSPPRKKSESLPQANISDGASKILNTQDSTINNDFLRDSYLTSKNLRAFIDTAKQHPEKGGYWYAYMAGSYCAQVHLFQQGAPEISLRAEPQIIVKPDSDPEVNQRRQRDLDEITSKCQGVTKDDFSRPSLSVEMRGAKDVAWAAMAAYDEPDIGKKTTLLKALLDLNDPFLIRDAGMPLINNSTLDGSFYEGVLVPLPIINAAWSLMPCTLGTPCGTENPLVKLECAIRSQCYNDLESLLFNTGGATFNAVDRARIVSLSKSMSDSVRNKNVAAFLPPSKK
ncbi:MAG: hypothetical protein WCB36_11005 [Burkholderiales bacterium]